MESGRILPKPRIGRMGYNPANFAYHIGTGPWVRGYRAYYAISFYDERTGRESPRSEWWERLIHEIKDNVTTKYQDRVL